MQKKEGRDESKWFLKIPCHETNVSNSLIVKAHAHAHKGTGTFKY